MKVIRFMFITQSGNWANRCWCQRLCTFNSVHSRSGRRDIFCLMQEKRESKIIIRSRKLETITIRQSTRNNSLRQFYTMSPQNTFIGCHAKARFVTCQGHGWPYTVWSIHDVFLQCIFFDCSSFIYNEL